MCGHDVSVKSHAVRASQLMANGFATSANRTDNRLQGLRSRMAQYRKIAGDEGGRGLQPERRSEIDQILHRIGDLVTVAKREQILLLQPEACGDFQRARAVGRAALRINLAVERVELVGRAQFCYREFDARGADRRYAQ